MLKTELVLVNVVAKQDKFGFVPEQKELVCRPGQSVVELGLVDTREC